MKPRAIDIILRLLEKEADSKGYTIDAWVYYKDVCATLTKLDFNEPVSFEEKQETSYKLQMLCKTLGVSYKYAMEKAFVAINGVNA